MLTSLETNSWEGSPVGSTSTVANGRRTVPVPAVRLSKQLGQRNDDVACESVSHNSPSGEGSVGPRHDAYSGTGPALNTKRCRITDEHDQYIPELFGCGDVILLNQAPEYSTNLTNRKLCSRQRATTGDTLAEQATRHSDSEPIGASVESRVTPVSGVPVVRCLYESLSRHPMPSYTTSEHSPVEHSKHSSNVSSGIVHQPVILSQSADKFNQTSRPFTDRNNQPAVSSTMPVSKRHSTNSSDAKSDLTSDPSLNLLTSGSGPDPSVHESARHQEIQSSTKFSSQETILPVSSRLAMQDVINLPAVGSAAYSKDLVHSSSQSLPTRAAEPQPAIASTAQLSPITHSASAVTVQKSDNINMGQFTEITQIQYRKINSEAAIKTLQNSKTTESRLNQTVARSEIDKAVSHMLNGAAAVNQNRSSAASSGMQHMGAAPSAHGAVQSVSVAQSNLAQPRPYSSNAVAMPAHSLPSSPRSSQRSSLFAGPSLIHSNSTADNIPQHSPAMFTQPVTTEGATRPAHEQEAADGHSQRPTAAGGLFQYNEAADGLVTYATKVTEPAKHPVAATAPVQHPVAATAPVQHPVAATAPVQHPVVGNGVIQCHAAGVRPVHDRAAVTGPAQHHTTAAGLVKYPAASLWRAQCLASAMPGYAQYCQAAAVQALRPTCHPSIVQQNIMQPSCFREGSSGSNPIVSRAPTSATRQDSRESNSAVSTGQALHNAISNIPSSAYQRYSASGFRPPYLVRLRSHLTTAPQLDPSQTRISAAHRPTLHPPGSERLYYAGPPVPHSSVVSARAVKPVRHTQNIPAGKMAPYPTNALRAAPAPARVESHQPTLAFAGAFSSHPGTLATYTGSPLYITDPQAVSRASSTAVQSAGRTVMTLPHVNQDYTDNDMTQEELNYNQNARNDDRRRASTVRGSARQLSEKGSGERNGWRETADKCLREFGNSREALLRAEAKRLRPDDDPQYLDGCKRIVNFTYELWKEQALCDVIMKTNTDEIKAHRIALASFSDFLDRNFRSCPENEIVVVDVSDYDIDIVFLLVHFVYTTELSITTRTVGRLIQCADELGFSVVVRMCLNYLHHLHPSNAILFYCIAENHGLSNHLKDIRSYILDRFLEVSRTNQFLLLPADRLLGFLCDDELNVDEEVEVFRAVVRWVEEESTERIRAAHQLLEEGVRLFLISPEQLIDTVQKVDWINSNSQCARLIHQAMSFHALRATGSQLARKFVACRPRRSNRANKRNHNSNNLT